MSATSCVFYPRSTSCALFSLFYVTVVEIGFRIWPEKNIRATAGVNNALGRVPYKTFSALKGAYIG